MDLGLAWTWERQEGGVFISKNGAVGGFISEVVVDRNGGRVAAVVTNSGSFSANDLAEMLIPLQYPEKGQETK